MTYPTFMPYGVGSVNLEAAALSTEIQSSEFLSVRDADFSSELFPFEFCLTDLRMAVQTCFGLPFGWSGDFHRLTLTFWFPAPVKSLRTSETTQLQCASEPDLSVPFTC